MSAKTLICLKGNFEGLPVIQRAHALGHRLVVVDKAPAQKATELADLTIFVDAYDADATLKALKTEDIHPDGVICCCGDMPHTAAAVVSWFKLPGLTPEQAFRSINKPEQKRILSAVVDVPSMMRWPRIVVKPPDSRGARGVKLLDTGGVVEEYLDGPQLSTESIVQDGKVLFTAVGLRNYGRLAEFAPYIIEDGYDMPYPLPPLTSGWKNLDSMLATACQELGWDNLTVKGDWIIHDGQLVILELAARLSGGFFSTHGIPLAYGVDFVEAAIGLALGHRVEVWGYGPLQLMARQHCVCQRYVFPAPEDIGRRVQEVPLIPDGSIYSLEHGVKMSLLGIAFATYAIHPGDVISPVVSHGQRWGQATCTGATPEQARELAEQAVAAMKAAVVLE